MAKRVFRLLRGVHSEGGKVYHKGEVFESNANLLAQNYYRSDKNGKPTSPFSVKFEEVNRDTINESDLAKAGRPVHEDLASVQPELSDIVDTSKPVEETETDTEGGNVAVIKSPYTRHELEDMKTAELEELADDMEIDLSKISASARYRKKQLVSAILGE